MAVAMHIVAAQLRPDASTETRSDLLSLAEALASIEEVDAVMVGHTKDEFVTATWLRDRDSLEAFAAAPEHMRFVMEGLAVATTGMWSTSIVTEHRPPEHASSLWAFALPAVDGVYEWQVRETLATIEALPGETACGPTIEARDRYRAAGVVGLTDRTRPAFEQGIAGTVPPWGAQTPLQTTAIMLATSVVTS